MSPELIGGLGFAVALVLIALRVPVAISLGMAGIVGGTVLGGWHVTKFVLSSAPFEAVLPYGLSVIPLFVAMGVFSARSGLSRNLYAGVYSLIGHFRGGLAMATIGACAVFGTICGSSLATAATMAKVAMPEMKKRGYHDSLASASVAAGGTLGVLIPPSIILVIYALLTEESIGALFAAAMVPGLVATFLYIMAIAVKVRIDPASGPAGEVVSWRERGAALLRVWDIAILMTVVLGGIYGGAFSPNEGAAVGALGALLFTVIHGQFTRRVVIDGLAETAATTGMIFLILIGAALFNYFIESSALPAALSRSVAELGWSPLAVMTVIILLYLVLGCLMDTMSMVLLTVPVIHPVILALGFDPVWFGVVLVTVVEVGLITPPIGMNLFVIQGVTPGLGLSTICGGVIPFIVADVVRVSLLVLIPGLCLWLPRSLGF